MCHVKNFWNPHLTSDLLMASAKQTKNREPDINLTKQKDGSKRINCLLHSSQPKR